MVGVLERKKGTDEEVKLLKRFEFNLKGLNFVALFPSKIMMIISDSNCTFCNTSDLKFIDSVSPYKSTAQ